MDRLPGDEEHIPPLRGGEHWVWNGGRQLERDPWETTRPNYAGTGAPRDNQSNTRHEQPAGPDTWPLLEGDET